MSEIVALLGEPTATTNRQKAMKGLFGNAPTVVIRDESSVVPDDSSASWVRSEGRYVVHFSNDYVVDAHFTPAK